MTNSLSSVLRFAASAAIATVLVFSPFAAGLAPARAEDPSAPIINSDAPAGSDAGSDIDSGAGDTGTGSDTGDTTGADGAGAGDTGTGDTDTDGMGAGTDGSSDFNAEVQTNVAPLDADVIDGNIATLQAAINSATPGDTITVSGIGYTGDLNVSNSVILTSTTGATITGKVTINAANVTVSGFTITNPSGNFGVLINGVGGANVNGNTIHDVATSATSINSFGIYYQSHSAGDVSGVVIHGNTISNIGKAIAFSNGGIGIGDSSGTSIVSGVEISDNQITNVTSTKGAYGIILNHTPGVGNTPGAVISGNTITGLTGGWAHGIGLEGNTPNAALSGNTISGLTAGSDAYAIYFEDNASKNTVTVDGSAISAPTSVAVSGTWTGLGAGGVVSLGGNSYVLGSNAFATIQAGVNAAADGATVNVAAGTYNEDVVANKHITLKGAGMRQSIISGPKGGSADTLDIGSGATVDGFTITRDGNNVADWSNANGVLNNQGVTFLQSPTSNSTLKNSEVTGNRNGVYMNTSQGNTLTGNVITGNRTGIQFAGNISGLTATDNQITDNFTLGVLFNLVSGTPTSGSNIKVNNNTITGNWYGAIVNRSGGSLSTFDVTNNYYGHSVVTTSTSNSTEPGYDAQIPVAFGGTATAPTPAAADLEGDISFLMYSPWLGSDEGEDAPVVSQTDTVTSTTTTSDDGVVLSVDVAAGTVITGDENWDGDIAAALTPIAIATTTLDSIEISGFENIVPSAAIKVGTDDNTLILSNAARLQLSGQAGKSVGWTHTSDGSDFTQITTVCTADDQATVDAQLGEGQDCMINVGSDLVVWTKHFTTFVTYAATQTSTGSHSTRGHSGASGPRTTTVATNAGGSTGGQVLGAATFNFVTDLSYGSYAEGVSPLQQVLIDAGYLKIAAPTGWFGPMTQAAVKLYQAAHSIPNTGYVGPLTRGALNASVTL